MKNITMDYNTYNKELNDKEYKGIQKGLSLSKKIIVALKKHKDLDRIEDWYDYEDLIKFYCEVLNIDFEKLVQEYNNTNKQI